VSRAAILFSRPLDGRRDGSIRNPICLWVEPRPPLAAPSASHDRRDRTGHYGLRIFREQCGLCQRLQLVSHVTKRKERTLILLLWSCRSSAHFYFLRRVPVLYRG